MLQRLIDWIKNIFRDPDPLDPVDFIICLKKENLSKELVAIELHNDNVTTMDFVVKIIEAYFQLKRGEAVKLMLEVHAKGVGRIEWMDKGSANLVLKQIDYESSKRNFSFQCTIVNA